MQKEKQSENKTTTAELPLVEQMARDYIGLSPDDEGYEGAKLGLEYLIGELAKPAYAKTRANQAVVNKFISEIDRKIGEQVDIILHDPTFQELESAWKGLKLLVDRTNFREKIKIELLNVSKDDMIADFEEAPEIMKSGLYKTVYTAEYGMFGGEPIGAIIGNYDFGPGARDVKLLENFASISTMAHAIFIAAASPEFFRVPKPKKTANGNAEEPTTAEPQDTAPEVGQAEIAFKDQFLPLPNLKDLKAHLEGPKFIKWDSFRNSEDSRSVGLVLPRILLRLPYSPKENPAKKFEYHENVSGDHEAYLWGNAAFGFATRLTDSFAKYRWCANIIGPQGGGALENLPVHVFDSMGTHEAKIPTEILISHRRDYELSEEGFIPLVMRKGSDNACFFSANSCQRPKTFGQSEGGKEAETNYRLGTQLPYAFIVSRLAHYIKVLQHEQIGTWKERVDVEKGLNKWLMQYVAGYEAQPGVRSRRPLREAHVKVSDVAGDPGWYQVEITVRPHFKYMGAYFTLSLVGKLDKE